jgi:hypothetical protein
MPRRKSTLTVAEILAWADDHHRRTGKHPSADSGPVQAAPGENWNLIDQALDLGLRGLPGQETLAQLLMRERGHRHLRFLPRLSEETILGWARAHREQTGDWPGREAGPVAAAPGEVWGNIDQAMRRGGRGLPGGDSLARLLARAVGVSPQSRRGKVAPRPGPPLSLPQILGWAHAYRLARGKWPLPTSPAAGLPPGETWLEIDRALRHGGRGLPGASSLVQLLVASRQLGSRRRGLIPVSDNDLSL